MQKDRRELARLCYATNQCTGQVRVTSRGTKVLISFLALAVSLSTVSAFEEEFKPLLNSTCLACHSNELLSQLNFLELEHDLTKPEIYRKWERVYDRLERGEMPPVPMPTPDESVLAPAMSALKEALIEANVAKRGEQRAPLKRLTRLEYQYTIQDLLDLDPAVAKQLVVVLPEEADTGGFDTVAANQGISSMHVRGYMTAAQEALDAALKLGPPPEKVSFKTEYANSGYLRFMSTAKILGGGVTKVIPGGVVTIFDTASTYLFHSGSEGFHPTTPGQYDVTVEAFPYQASLPITVTLYKGTQGAAAAAALSELVGSFDLTGPEVSSFTVRTFMAPGDVVSPSIADHETLPNAFTYYEPENNMSDYKGEGIAFKSLAISGPINEQWPPASTRNLLVGIEFEDNQPVLTKSPAEHIQEIVETFGKRAFRRALKDSEIQHYMALAEPALNEGRDFVDTLRIPLNAILTSPSFLFLQNGNGTLDSFAVASRLSYLIWRSMPDEELLQLASEDALTDSAVLRAQIDRMFDDPKSDRFVKDFVGQAYRIYEMHATSPDSGLYPEFDDRLAQAMRAETELFFKELIKNDMSIRKLVDADFTFVNRRLAEHYQIPDIKGQEMRKVALPQDHVRGGLLAQAAVHKITANGTTTSPVPRGNFVLTNLLGQPAPPPPPEVSGLEPDTRGTTTIREQLDAHRSNTVCASCHLSIDPPGFAMESFDPIGGFRENYRASSGQVVEALGEVHPGPYILGLAVDSSGVTPEGDSFDGYLAYLKLLQDKKLKYIARHFASQIVVLATGSEVQFADRDEVNAIVASVAEQDYPMREMIHAIAQSDIFRRP